MQLFEILFYKQNYSSSMENNSDKELYSYSDLLDKQNMK